MIYSSIVKSKLFYNRDWNQWLRKKFNFINSFKFVSFHEDYNIERIKLSESVSYPDLLKYLKRNFLNLRFNFRVSSKYHSQSWETLFVISICQLKHLKVWQVNQNKLLYTWGMKRVLICFELRFDRFN